TVRLQPAAQAATFFASWPWQQAQAVVAAWQQLAPHAPDQLYAICALSTAASQPTVRVFGQYLGDEAALTGLLAPLRAPPGTQPPSCTGRRCSRSSTWPTGRRPAGDQRPHPGWTRPGRRCGRTSPARPTSATPTRIWPVGPSPTTEPTFRGCAR